MDVTIILFTYERGIIVIHHQHYNESQFILHRPCNNSAPNFFSLVCAATFTITHYIYNLRLCTITYYATYSFVVVEVIYSNLGQNCVIVKVVKSCTLALNQAQLDTMHS